MDLQLTTTRIGEHPVVSLSGIADLSTAPQLHDYLRRTCAEHPGRTLMIDIDGLIAVDDSALGLLLGAAARARQTEGDLELVCSSPRIRDRLATTRLDRALVVHDSVAVGGSQSKQILHIAIPGDWQQAQSVGQYRVATRGVTLEQEGFIHCSYPNQVEGVANRFYGDLAELLLLHVDPDHLDAELRVEPPAAGIEELFPHIYGPIPTAAVITTTSWHRSDNATWRYPPAA